MTRLGAAVVGLLLACACSGGAADSARAGACVASPAELVGCDGDEVETLACSGDARPAGTCFLLADGLWCCWRGEAGAP